VVLAPSLWWESSGRVLAEAMLNGIPAITTQNGGAPEMVEEGGILLKLPERYFAPPYSLMPSDDEIAQIAGLVEAMYDDTAMYERLSACALGVGRRVHDIAANTQRLHERLLALVADHGERRADSALPAT
jgi:glycosyltransferase involved in cell wall biosynthesis